MSFDLDEVQRLKYTLWSGPEEEDEDRDSLAGRIVAALTGGTSIVAEGDSWFDYPFELDILDHLRWDYGYRVRKVARAGDTLENMAWGTGYRPTNYRRYPPALGETLDAIRATRPQALLLSAGGNDLAGEALDAYLNHRASGLPALRRAYVESAVFETGLAAYRHIAQSAWAVQPDLHILFHGYGYPIPDGRAVIRLLPGLSFVGPWLRPGFTRKGITSDREAREILRAIIDRFNDMLATFAQEDPRLHYLDLREAITDEDWVNELHLSSAAYRRIATRFHEALHALRLPPPDPVP